MPAAAILDHDPTTTYCDGDMSATEHRLAVVMYTDIVGFSRMMEADEAATLETLSEYARLIRDRVDASGGRVVRTVGDSVLCEFATTTKAVACARAILSEAAARNRGEPPQRYGVRIGMHVGDIYFSEHDAFGDAVGIAHQLQEYAAPGRICVSQDVHNQMSGRLDAPAERVGALRLKGSDRSVDVYEIAVDQDAEFTPPGWRLSRPADPRDGSARATAASDAAAAEQRRADEAEARVKAFVLDEIRRVGRRVSVDEVRERLPERGPQIDAAVERLARKGFLARHRTPGAADVGRTERAGRDVGRFGSDPRSVDARPPTTGDDDATDKWDEKRWRGDEKAARQMESGWDRALREPGPPPGAYDSLVEDYKDHAANVAQKERAGFRGHLVSYLGVNGGLFLLWAMTMFGSFPWFLIVLFAWGIGLASHFVGMRDKVAESRDVDGAQGLTREQLRIYRRLVRARAAWKGHLVSNVATSLFLVVLNLITGPSFFWAAFPVGFMTIGLLSHLPAYKAKERRLLKRLQTLGARIGGAFRRTGDRDASERPEPITGSGPGSEAELVRRRLLAAIEASPKGSPLGDDFVPVLDNYVEQIKSLDRKSSELDQIMDAIPVADLERDLLALQQKRDASDSQPVRVEYDKSIDQIRKQQSSYAELRNAREMLRLRLSSGLNQLRQLEIDVARMQSVSSDENPASVSMLREKSEELSEYLEDLRQGYRELE